jgi:hypothetical protein
MKPILLVSTAFLAASAAFAFEPAVEQSFSQLASTGCSDSNADFIVRGMVSNANENTVVLSDPTDARSTISLTLPGRGPFTRAKGWFGDSKYETSDQVLNALRAAGTPVVVTLKCKGNGTPIARNISYQNADGTNSSISY